MLKRFTIFNLPFHPVLSGRFSSGELSPGGISPGRRFFGALSRLSALPLALFILSATARAQSYNVSAPVILQDFDSTYLSIENKMPDIFQSGYGAVYLPPPGYSTTTNSVGYDVYNRFDLGTAQQAHHLRHSSRIRDPSSRASIPSAERRTSTCSGTTPPAWTPIPRALPPRADIPAWPSCCKTPTPTRPDTTPWATTKPEPPAAQPTPTTATTYYYVGDFHDPTEPSNGLDGQVAGLDDIAQEENNMLIRQPTTAGNPQNIPAGTTPWNGYLANVPNAANAQYYPDLSKTPKTVYDPALNQNFTLYPFNTANPMAGTPVAENATGYLMRYTQWMIQQEGVDGFRIDAAH